MVDACTWAVPRAGERSDTVHAEDASKARQKLGWTPEVSFAQLVQEMVDCDLDIARRDALVAREGFKTYHYHE